MPSNPSSSAARALEKSEDAGLDIKELQRELKCVSEELAYLKTFSRRLLAILKLRFELDDAGLDGLMQRAQEAQERLDEKPGFHQAPLCAFCARPLQEDSAACIYCGMKAA